MKGAAQPSPASRGTFTVFSREGTLLHDAEKRCQAAPQHRAGPRITERLPPNSMAGPSDSTHEGAGPGLTPEGRSRHAATAPPSQG